MIPSSGSFVDRAIVREIKTAAARFSETDLMWSEVLILTRRWKEGMPELQMLEALRRINRVASCWKAPEGDPVAGEADHPLSCCDEASWRDISYPRGVAPE
jgi:hypothetical protein